MTQRNIQSVHEIIMLYYHISHNKVKVFLNISRTQVHLVLHDHLKLEKIMCILDTT